MCWSAIGQRLGSREELVVMLREMFTGKIHRATVTDCKIDYPGSLTVDTDLLERAGILVYEKFN